MNSWTSKNGKIHEHIVKHNDPDLICLVETHLKAGDELEVEGYNYVGLYRVKTNKRALQNSYGIGRLIKAMLCETFTV